VEAIVAYVVLGLFVIAFLLVLNEEL